MEKPLDFNTLTSEVGKRIIDQPEIPPQGYATDTVVTTELVPGESIVKLKRGTVGKFEVYSDEPARIGGTDQYPTPMHYMSMGMGF